MVQPSNCGQEKKYPSPGETVRKSLVIDGEILRDGVQELRDAIDAEKGGFP